MSSSALQSSSSLMKVLRELDAGLMDHTTWLKVLHRVMVSGSEHNPADLMDDAHCRCRFGLWYYGKKHPELQDGPWFKNIGIFHENMHSQARRLLLKKDVGQPITPDEYDQFMDLAIRFKLEVRSLQSDIINRVCEVDHLTGARNRNSMHFKLLEEHDRMLRNNHPCCLCMMDIDHFKQVNDTHGHLAGDSVLHAAVHFLGKKMRRYDTIFRFGGEEFLLCLPNTGLQEGFAIVDRLRAELATLPIKLKENGEISITASFGLASMNPDETVEDAIQKADHALLCAKSAGRNRVCQWDIEAGD
ncbi:MAG: diguanylate cyclase [Sideroxyarcus sp.]|nr:diguanylate cyclase [Sideroxyarcus sp.]